MVRSTGIRDTSRDPSEPLRLPPDAPLPIAETIRSGAAIYVGSNAQLEFEHPELRRLDPKDHACASLPLEIDRDVVGAVNLCFSRPRSFTSDEQRLLSRVGEQCSAALARASRFELERDRRRTAELLLREGQALELNDEVVQQLAVAKLALELEDRIARSAR